MNSYKHVPYSSDLLLILAWYSREPDGDEVTVTGLLEPAGSFGFLWNLYCRKKLNTLGLVPLDIFALARYIRQHFWYKKFEGLLIKIIVNFYETLTLKKAPQKTTLRPFLSASLQNVKCNATGQWSLTLSPVRIKIDQLRKRITHFHKWQYSLKSWGKFKIAWQH